MQLKRILSSSLLIMHWMAMTSIKLLILTMKERNFEYLQRLQLSCHSPYPVVFWEQRLGSANRCHGVAVKEFHARSTRQLQQFNFLFRFFIWYNHRYVPSFWISLEHKSMEGDIYTAVYMYTPQGEVLNCSVLQLPTCDI